RPFVFAFPIAPDFFEKTVGAIVSFQREEEERTTALKELLTKLDVNERSKTVAAANPVGVGSLSQTSDETGPGADSAAASEDVVELLTGVGRDDLAGFLLMDALMSRFQIATILGGSMRVVGAQKKANVCYLRIQTFIPQAKTNNHAPTPP